MLTSSSSCRPTPVAPATPVAPVTPGDVRPRRFRRVLYPASRSRRPPTREPPDQALRWLLLLSALVFLQIYNEETNTCTGWAAHTHTHTLVTHKLIHDSNWCFEDCISFGQGKFHSIRILLQYMPHILRTKYPPKNSHLTETWNVCPAKTGVRIRPLQCLDNWLNCASVGEARRFSNYK